MKASEMWGPVVGCGNKKKDQDTALTLESEMCIRMLRTLRREGLTSPDGWKKKGVRDS